MALVAACSSSSDPTTVFSGESLDPTPSQQEGPYYPVAKPSDRDSDLTTIEGESNAAGGQVLVMNGALLDTAGQAIEGALIEIWQTDENGIYLHPNDPAVAERDTAFQGYGESPTQSDGSWSFRTVNPGYYEPRPRHIHVKVLIDDVVVLTTQIYFSDDPDADGTDPALVAEVAIEDDGTLTASHMLVVSSR